MNDSVSAHFNLTTREYGNDTFAQPWPPRS